MSEDEWKKCRDEAVKKAELRLWAKKPSKKKLLEWIEAVRKDMDKCDVKLHEALKKKEKTKW